MNDQRLHYYVAVGVTIGLALLLCAGCTNPYLLRAERDRAVAYDGYATYERTCRPYLRHPDYPTIQRDCESLLETGRLLLQRAAWYEAHAAGAPNGFTTFGAGLAGAAAGARGDYSLPLATQGGVWVQTPNGSIFGPNGETIVRTPNGSYVGDGFMLYNGGGGANGF